MKKYIPSKKRTLIIISIILLLFWVISQIIIKSEQLIIKNLMVEFGDYDPLTGKAGAFIFDHNEEKIFLEFGANAGSPNGTHILPTFEYLTDPNAKVFAVADGVITDIKYQDDTEDYEILVSSSRFFSKYTICYDHIKNLQINNGDHITAGTVIGTVGNWTEDLGRTELMVKVRENGKHVPYCPFEFFDQSLLSEYQQKVMNLINEWEEFKGDESIYDESQFIWAGCPYKKLPAED